MKMLKKFFLFFIFLLGMTSCSSRSKKIIYVYKDLGVSKESLAHTLYSLKMYIAQGYPVQTINAKKVKEGKWIKDAILLIMPGGADIPYVKKLRGLGNQMIKKFVSQGGSYLGICAGGYYGSSSIEFDKGGPLEVLDCRELAFFSGTSVGPFLGDYEYGSNKGARVATVIDGDSSKKIGVFFNGGSYFRGAEDKDHIKIIGWYQQEDGLRFPAIIYTKYGKGNVILSGVHFEYQPELLDQKDPFLHSLIPRLEEDKEDCINLFKKTLKLLML